MFTIKCKCVAKEQDLLGYQTLVFKDLENSQFGYQYRMVTVFYNWEARVPDIGEVGYLEYDSVEAGIDKYYDKNSKEFKVYNYTNLIFYKFVKEKDNSTKDIIL